MATAKTEGKSGFLKEFFVDHPAAKKADIDKAWREAGNEGKISESLIYLVRNELGLTGKGRVKLKAKAKATTGAAKRTAAAPQALARPAAKSASATKTNGNHTTVIRQVPAALRATGGDRTRILIEFEHRIDELLTEASSAGGLPEFEDALRRARRILARSHGG